MSVWEIDQRLLDRPFMKRSSPTFARCVFVPYSQRDNLPKNAKVYDVSSYADEPFCRLSPMYVHGGIPVPGMAGITSDTVEGIWQGLKLIRGKTAPRYFRTRGYGLFRSQYVVSV